MGSGFNEKVVVQSLRNGDPLAFEVIFLRYSPRLYQFSFAYLKSEADAEDIVGEVFYKLWRNREAIKVEESFQSYLFTIALNFIKKFFNKKSKADKYKQDFLDGYIQESYQQESSIIYKDLLDKLGQIVEQLPERRKRIFIERRINEKSVKQIAKEMDIDPKTVENQLAKAIPFLKEELRSERFRVYKLTSLERVVNFQVTL